ncbi:Stk1 family PASTA domain-containing Ser/Thr kinase [Naumannella halotolerans]
MLGGRYELQGLLGRGGMAEVRRAYDTRLGRPVAIKQLRTDLASDPMFQARFRREAQSAAGLNHPNIVAVYDTGEEVNDDGTAIPYIVMELVEGLTLREVLRDDRKILPERALEITQGILDALAYSHTAGIIHRDIKPANVMLTPQGQVKVMDFGIARAVADSSATMTQTAAVIGTAQYLSPEQARGETVDNRSDIYSAGCVLYELLTGRPPFIGDSPVSVAYQHVREQPVPPSHFDPAVTPDVDAICLKALSKDPDDRYHDAREMRDDISRVLAGQSATAMLPVGAADPDATRVVPAAAPLADPDALDPDDEDADGEDEEERRSKKAPIIIALAVLLVVAGALGLWWWNRSQPVEPVLVQVPALEGSTQAGAESTLTNQGLQSTVEETKGADDETVGTVVDQDPPAGDIVEQGSTVTITINVGPDKGAIPSGLVGMDVDEAQSELEDAGFTNVTATADEDSDEPENQVISVDPSSGEEVALDDPVTLTYSEGLVTVPDWVNGPREDVESEASELGLDVSFSTVETYDTPDGYVVSQSVDPDSRVTRGTQVDVVVAETPPTVEPSDEPAPSSEPSEDDSPSPSPSNDDGDDDGSSDPTEQPTA